MHKLFFKEAFMVILRNKTYEEFMSAFEEFDHEFTNAELMAIGLNKRFAAIPLPVVDETDWHDIAYELYHMYCDAAKQINSLLDAQNKCIKKYNKIHKNAIKL
jgi:hypothetical protein